MKTLALKEASLKLALPKAVPESSELALPQVAPVLPLVAPESSGLVLPQVAPAFVFSDDVIN